VPFQPRVGVASRTVAYRISIASRSWTADDGGSIDPVAAAVRHHLFQTDSSCPSRQFPDSLLAAQQDLRRNAPFRFLVGAEAKAQELSLGWSSHCTLGLVYLELEPSREQARAVCHHPLSRSLAADVDIAVVRIPHEAMLAPFEFPVEFVEYDVR